jgi:lysophospholipase L1-like esterase
MKKVCIFGASITSGRNDHKNGGWCDLLKRHFLDQQIFIFNLGVSGDDTLDLLKRLKNECEARQPDAIIIALGGNDSQYFFEQNKFRVPLEQTKENFKKIIEISKKYTSKIIIVGLTKVDEKKINSQYMKIKKKMYKNEYLQLYDQAIKHVAENHRLQFIPTFDLIQENDLDDGLHPTTLGHKKLFLRIQKHIQI